MPIWDILDWIDICGKLADEEAERDAQREKEAIGKIKQEQKGG